MEGLHATGREGPFFIKNRDSRLHKEHAMRRCPFRIADADIPGASMSQCYCQCDA